MEEKGNREFSWIDIIDSTEELDKNEVLTESDSKNHENEGRAIPVPVAGTIYTFSSNVGSMADENVLTHEEEEQSERLGEELEKDFGDIEPSEPFGPIDPGEPEPGEPISNLANTADLEEFDPYKMSEHDLSAQDEPQLYYLTKEEFEGLATKREIKILTKAVKKLRTSIEAGNKKNTKRSRNTILLSVMLSLILIAGAFFTIYYVLPKWFPEKAITPASPQNSAPAGDEYAPTTVSGVSKAAIK